MDHSLLPPPPTVRELELETILRQRDADLLILRNEVTTLRKHVASSNAPLSDGDLVSIPPALFSFLLPYISEAHSVSNAGTAPGSSVTAALTQRAKLLQEENDEMYQILRRSETGRLDEEVKGMRKLIAKLEGALRVDASASTELDKTYETIEKLSKTNNEPPHRSQPRPPNSPLLPRNNALPSPHPSTASATSTGNGISAKPIPTGPRAHKKPRINPSPTPVPGHHRHVSSGIPTNPRQSGKTHPVENGRPPSSMDVDHPADDNRGRPRNELQIRGSARRGGGSGRGGGGGPTAPGQRTTGKGGFSGGDRTLVERMGL